MSYLQQLGTLRAASQLAPGVWNFLVDCPALAQQARAGQFVHLRVEGFSLRRPISICEIDVAAGTLRLVFEVRGAGTAKLAQTPVGGELDLLGPLGNGFSLPTADQKIIVVGGGIGVPPLLGTAAAHGKNATAILGFRSSDAVILAADFERYGCDLRLATDDGSAGHHGFVTDLLAKRLEESPADLICACGPLPMLQKTAALAEQAGIACQVSLEERMGCGVGACLVCACKTVRDGKEIFRHVCKDGPVFESTEVVW